MRDFAKFSVSAVLLVLLANLTDGKNFSCTKDVSDYMFL